MLNRFDISATGVHRRDGMGVGWSLDSQEFGHLWECDRLNSHELWAITLCDSEYGLTAARTE
jgi:hypothetical protein